MIPPGALLEAPFARDGVLGQMRAFLASHAGRPVELELVLRVTMHSDDAALLAAQPDVLAAAAINKDPARWGIDRLRLWPQLPEALGVWLNLSTANDWFARVHTLLDAFARLGPPPAAVLHDLEPRKDALDALLRGDIAGLREIVRSAAPAAALIEGALEGVSSLRRRLPPAEGFARHTAAVVPMWSGFRARGLIPSVLRSLLLDPRTGRALYDGFDVMCYTSMSTWFLPSPLAHFQPQAEARVAAWVAQDHGRWCQRVGASSGLLFGCTGTGLLGDEPLYKTPASLAQVTRAARAPIDRVGIYNLRGLLEEPAAVASGKEALRFDRDWRPWLAALVAK